jgi:exonuclease VII small subunit
MILIEDCFKELEEIISGKIEEQKVRQEKANKLFIEAFGLGIYSTRPLPKRI